MVSLPRENAQIEHAQEPTASLPAAVFRASIVKAQGAVKMKGEGGGEKSAAEAY